MQTFQQTKPHVNQRPNQQPNQQQGFTMVELMVAIVLALLLAIVAGQSYLSTKSTYRATEQTARIQENLRFATHFVNRDIRRAGNLGCFQNVTSHLQMPANISGLYNLNHPVNVWRWGAQGSVNDLDLSSGLAYTTPDGNNGHWRDAANTTRPAPDNLDGKVMEGNDIIVITRISEPLGIRLSNNNLRTSQNLQIANLNNQVIEAGQIMLVGDCNAAEMFVHTGGKLVGNTGTLARASGTDTLVQNRQASFGATWQKNWQSGADVRFIESILYFIGEGTSDLPALFKLDLSKGLGTATNPVQPLEIVDGIEVMKALAGVDTNSDGALDQYLRIDQIGGINNIRNVLNLQVGMLAVGDQNTNLTDINARTFQLTQRHTVTSPTQLPDNNALQDTRYRQATTTTVQIRNTGLDRSPKIY